MMHNRAAIGQQFRRHGAGDQLFDLALIRHGKNRQQKLKVYCTPVGFHDAFVAAPSQKAALEARGAKTNLFAQGAAQTVNDARLIKAPLKRPGEVIKVLRGSDAEQLAALEKTAHRTAPSLGVSRQEHPEGDLILDSLNRALSRGDSAKPRVRKPSRAKLAKAEESLAALEMRQAKELQRLKVEEQRIEARLRDLERKQANELIAARERIEKERSCYHRAVRAWKKGA